MRGKFRKPGPSSSSSTTRSRRARSSRETRVPRIVKQSVTLPASSKDLYSMYLNPRAHAALTGGKVAIGARSGSKFSAFGGALSGRMLQTIPEG